MAVLGPLERILEARRGRVAERQEQYIKMLFNFTRCGDLTVIGMAILANIDENLIDAKIECHVVKKSIEYLIKRHPLLRAQIDVEIKKFILKFRMIRNASQYRTWSIASCPRGVN